MRVGEADDGINYDPNSSDNLRVQLVFGEERSAEDFESQFSRLSNRWHKRPSLSIAVPEMSIESEGVSTVPFSGALTRMMSSNYRKVEKAGDTEVSPADFDQYSWTSIVTGVEVDDEVRLRLMEREDSKALFRQKAQKCYIIGRENKRYESTPTISCSVLGTCSSSMMPSIPLSAWNSSTCSTSHMIPVHAQETARYHSASHFHG